MVGGRGCYQPIITTNESTNPTFNIQQTYRFVHVHLLSSAGFDPCHLGLLSVAASTTRPPDALIKVGSTLSRPTANKQLVTFLGQRLVHDVRITGLVLLGNFTGKPHI